MQKFHRLQVVEDDEVQALCPQVIEVGHASAEDQIQRIFVFLNVLFFCPTRNRRRKTQLRMKPEKIDFEIFDHSKVGMLKLKLKLLNIVGMIELAQTYSRSVKFKLEWLAVSILKPVPETGFILEPKRFFIHCVTIESNISKKKGT